MSQSKASLWHSIGTCNIYTSPPLRGTDMHHREHAGGGSHPNVWWLVFHFAYFA